MAVAIITKSIAPKPGTLIGLGRLQASDPNDRKYLVRLPKAEVPLTYRRWYMPRVLDQGATSECVGHAARTLLDAGPTVNKLGPDQHEIYYEAQKVDEWPGEDYDGTSVRGAFKYLKRMGYIGEYRWAVSLRDIVDYCMNIGPMDMGTNWYMDMFTPTRQSYIEPMGGIAGGHSWVTGLITDTKYRNPDGTVGRQLMQNSWGPGWANKGRAWITFNNLERLLHEDGEAGVATEIKKVM